MFSTQFFQVSTVFSYLTVFFLQFVFALLRCSQKSVYFLQFVFTVFILHFLQFVFAVLRSLQKSVSFLQFVFAELRSLQFTEDWTVAVALKSAMSDGATD